MQRKELIEQAKKLISRKEYKKAWILLKPMADDPEIKKYMQHIKLQAQKIDTKPNSQHSSLSPRLSRKQWNIIVGSAFIGLIIIISLGIFFQQSVKEAETVAAIPTLVPTIDMTSEAIAQQATTDSFYTRTAEAHLYETATAFAQPTNTQVSSPTATLTVPATSNLMSIEQTEAVEAGSVPDIATPIAVPTITNLFDGIIFNSQYRIGSPGGYNDHVITATGLDQYTVLSNDFLPLVSLHDSEGNLLAENIRTLSMIDIPEARDLILRVRATNGKSYGAYQITNLPPNSRGLAYYEYPTFLEINYGTLLAGEEVQRGFWARTSDRVNFRFRARFTAEIEITDATGEILESFTTEPYSWRFFTTNPLPPSEDDVYNLTIRGINSDDSGSYELEYYRGEFPYQVDEDIPLSELILGEPNQGALTNNIQLWAFNAPENTSIRVEMEEDREDYILDVYSFSGQRMSMSQTSNIRATTSDSLITIFDLADGEDYILTIRPYDPENSRIAEQEYEIIVTNINREFSFDFPTVIYSQASAGFTDTYLFEAREGQTISADVNNRSYENYDYVLRLYAPDGSLIAVSDDTEDFSPRLTAIELPERGTYQLEVAGYDDFTPLDYELSTTISENFVATSPTLEDFGELLVANISAGNERIYEFNAEANDIIMIQTYGGQSIEHSLTLQGTDEFIESVDVNLSNRGLVYQLPQSGTYILAVRPERIQQSVIAYTYITKHASVEEATDPTYLELDTPISSAYLGRNRIPYVFEATPGELLFLEIFNTEVMFEQLRPIEYQSIIIDHDNGGVFYIGSPDEHEFELVMTFESDYDTFDLELRTISNISERLETAPQINVGSNIPSVIGENGITSFIYSGKTGDEITFDIADNEDWLQYVIVNDAELFLDSGTSTNSNEPVILQRDGNYLIDVVGIPNTDFTYTFQTTSTETNIIDEPIVTTTFDNRYNALDNQEMALRPDGRPLIIGESSNYIAMFDCTDMYCRFYDTIPILETDRVSAIHLVVTSDNRPVIAYISSQEELYVIHCNDPACASTDSRLIANNVGENLQLSLLSGDGLLITLQQDHLFQLIVCANIACDETSQNSIDLNTIDRIRMSYFEIRSDDRPIIGYTNQSGNLKIMNLLNCVDILCIEAETQQIELDSNTDFNTLAMAVSNDDTLSLVYDTNLPFDEPSITILAWNNEECSTYEINEIPLILGEDFFRIQAFLAKSNSSGQINIILRSSFRSSRNLDFSLIICGNRICSNANRYPLDDLFLEISETDMFFNNAGHPILFFEDEIFFCQSATCTN